jgi:hypothetical protein
MKSRKFISISIWSCQLCNYVLTIISVLVSNAGGPTAGWEPSAPLNRTDADVHLIIVSANSMVYEQPVDDPLFSAHLLSDYSLPVSDGPDMAFYEADSYARTIACADQHQICHGESCTQLSAYGSTFFESQGLTEVQRHVRERIRFASVLTGMTQVINGRSAAALRASDTALSLFQLPLPENQWQIELSSWFGTGIVMLQTSLRDFASPTNIMPGSYIRKLTDPIDLAMCLGQKTQMTNGTVSFSLLGLASILIVGMLVILTSLVLETVVGWIGPKGLQTWVMDGKFHLQRMVYEARGVSWTNPMRSIPVTEAGVRFATVAASPESQALMGAYEKTAGTNVREVQLGDTFVR